jgi:hypothetical protein
MGIRARIGIRTNSNTHNNSDNLDSRYATSVRAFGPDKKPQFLERGRVDIDIDTGACVYKRSAPTPPPTYTRGLCLCLYRGALRFNCLCNMRNGQRRLAGISNARTG